MRSFSLALLGAALTLAACQNKQADSPATGSAASDPETENVQLTPAQALERGSVPPSSTSPYKRYGIERAHIHYEVSGFKRGTEDLYFDNWGRKEARHMNLEDLLETGVRPSRNIIVTNGSYMQMADLVGGFGNFMTERVVDSLLKLEKVDSPEAISDTIMSRLGYTQKGQDTVLGLPTTIWHEGRVGTTLYVWKGVVLKQVVKTADQQHTVLAVSIDTTSPIHDSIFTAPKGIEYKPVPDRPGPGGGPPR